MVPDHTAAAPDVHFEFRNACNSAAFPSRTSCQTREGAYKTFTSSG